ncbi:MAG: hypothetical protein COA99_11040 [Moraxellaceae bacterium]|nr:MAG: hypothetical protein COA99_11040 [Moraxellaceae bacterium]
MTIAYACILIAALLPFVWTVAAKLSKPGFDNSGPRDFLNELEGWGQRANWAQINSFEAFPAFAAAVLVAYQLNNIDLNVLDALAVSFVVCRVLYGILYIADKATLRSLVWMAGMGCWVGIFLLSI